MSPDFLLDATLNGADLLAILIAAGAVVFAKARWARSAPDPDVVETAWRWPSRADRGPRPYDQAMRDIARST